MTEIDDYAGNISSWLNRSIQKIENENAKTIYRQWVIYELKRHSYKRIGSENYDIINPRHFALELKSEIRRRFGRKARKVINSLLKKL